MRLSDQKPSHEVEEIARRASRQDYVEAQIEDWCLFLFGRWMCYFLYFSRLFVFFGPVIVCAWCFDLLFSGINTVFFWHSPHMLSLILSFFLSLGGPEPQDYLT
jgi:uncharacterized membrane protein